MKQPTYIIDFDSTLVRCESLDELANLALSGRDDREAALHKLRTLTDRGMSGELPFDESLQQRLQLFTANREHLATLIQQLRQAITPSVLRCREWFWQNSDRIYVISGGFEDYIVPVVSRLDIAADHVLANAFEVDTAGIITGHDTSRHLGNAGGKVRQVAALKLPRPLIVIGDGFTDYEIRAAGEADEFWAFCENVDRPTVTVHADRILDSFDDVAAEDAYAVQ